jgi:hypothetical protein
MSAVNVSITADATLPTSHLSSSNLNAIVYISEQLRRINAGAGNYAKLDVAPQTLPATAYLVPRDNHNTPLLGHHNPQHRSPTRGRAHPLTTLHTHLLTRDAKPK